ncbi:MAG: LytR C-terminal domain-containing protein [Cellulomonadaceae bacterium]|nr:LytR C-terminal domain-containing protein [Cellulomonadaceae bacterium]
MSRAKNSYPPDEFDTARLGDTPVGVHRAPRSRASKVLPFVITAVVGAGLAVGVVAALANNPGISNPLTNIGASSPEPDPASPSPDVSPDDDASDDGSSNGDDGANQDADGGDAAAPAQTPPSTDDLIASANLAAHIRVLNEAGPQGEAGRGVQTLEARGFTQVEPGNFTGASGVTANTIWFAPGNEATAQAVAAIFGIPETNISQQTLRAGDIVVVIRSALSNGS